MSFDRILQKVIEQLQIDFNCPFAYTIHEERVQVHMHGVNSIDGIANFLSLNFLEEEYGEVMVEVLLNHYRKFFKRKIETEKLKETYEHVISNVEYVHQVNMDVKVWIDDEGNENLTFLPYEPSCLITISVERFKELDESEAVSLLNQIASDSKERKGFRVVPLEKAKQTKIYNRIMFDDPFC